MRWQSTRRLLVVAGLGAVSLWASSCGRNKPAGEPGTGGSDAAVLDAVATGDRPKHQDQHSQSEGRRRAVFQQLQTTICRRESGCGNTGPDHHRHQQGSAYQLGQQRPP